MLQVFGREYDAGSQRLRNEARKVGVLGLEERQAGEVTARQLSVEGIPRASKRYLPDGTGPVAEDGK